MSYRLRGVRLSECRDCHDPIRFVHLDTGSVIAVNPAEGAGNVAAAKIGNQLHGHVISRVKPAGRGAICLTPHAATCSAIERPEPKPTPDPHPALF